MSRTFWFIVLCLSAVVSFSPHARADVSAEERQQAFAWFDSVGYPDFAHLPLVKVYTGKMTDENKLARGDTGKPAPQYFYGVITKSDKTQFTAYWLWLQREEQYTIAARAGDRQAVYFEPTDLKAHALYLINRPPYNFDLTQDDCQSPIMLFVLARMCEGQGYSDLAAKLCNMSQLWMRSPKKDKQPSSFTDRIADEISEYDNQMLTLDFGDPANDRAALLRKGEAFLQHFPHSRFHDSATDIVTELKRMVEEDREVAAHPLPQKATTSLQERLAALIYALRDLRGIPWNQRNSFPGEREDKDPASQLVKLGTSAVPALLDTLTDSRLTRTVEWGRGADSSYHVLRIGDVAASVLERIAQRGFASGLDPKVTRPWKEDAVMVQQTARVWWTQVQAKGDTQVLIEAVHRGDWNAVGQAKRLAELHPDSALPALVEGIRQAQSDDIRHELVKVVVGLHGSEVLTVLRTQMLDGKDLDTRAQAAKALHQRGEPGVVERMIGEWREHAYPEPDSAFGANVELIQFLIGSGSPQAIAALGYRLTARGLMIRLSVITQLASEEAGIAPTAADRRSIPAQTGSATDSVQTRKARAVAAQAVLAGLLRDTESEFGNMSGLPQQYVDRHVCDVACFYLAKLWPHTYQFHFSSSPFDRTYQCITALNTWRSSQKLVPLPLPVRPRIQPFSASRLKPLLQQFAQDGPEGSRQKAKSDLLAIGLPALPAVREAGKGFRVDPATNKWLDLERQLSLTVRTARIESNGINAAVPLVRELKQMEGHSMTVTTLKNLVSDALDSLPKSASGVRVDAQRDNDGSGVVVLVTLIPSYPPNFRSHTMQSDESIIVGSEATYEMGSGTGRPGTGADYFKFSPLVNVLQKALRSSPYAPICIHTRYAYIPDRQK